MTDQLCASALHDDAHRVKPWLDARLRWHPKGDEKRAVARASVNVNALSG
jgi:hypothetical protein